MSSIIDNSCHNAVFYNSSTGEYASFKCKSPRCENCYPWYRKTFIKGVKNEINKWRRKILWTVGTNWTMDEYEAMLSSWNRLHTSLRHRYRGLKVIMATEIGDNGYLHIHFIANRFMLQRKVRELWSLATGIENPNVNFVPDVRNIGGYLAKYLSKEWSKSFPKGARRYNCTRGIHIFYRGELNSDWVLIWLDKLPDFISQHYEFEIEQFEEEYEKRKDIQPISGFGHQTYLQVT